jgi:hypothetical protein
VVNVSKIVYETLRLDIARMTMEKCFEVTYESFRRLNFVTPVNQKPFKEDRHRQTSSECVTAVRNLRKLTRYSCNHSALYS